ncbi:putative G-protein coupled receptor 139 [Rhinoraja longicauda]
MAMRMPCAARSKMAIDLPPSPSNQGPSLHGSHSYHPPPQINVETSPSVRMLPGKCNHSYPPPSVAAPQRYCLCPPVSCARLPNTGRAPRLRTSPAPPDRHRTGASLVRATDRKRRESAKQTVNRLGPARRLPLSLARKPIGSGPGISRPRGPCPLHQWGARAGAGCELQARVIGALCAVVCACADQVNLVAIVILSRGKCGLSKCITRYLLSMAVTDLLVIITAVLLNRVPAIYFPSSFMSITPVCSLSIALIYAARDCSVWLTVSFTFDRFVAICCQKLKTKYCTERTAGVVIGTICVLGCLVNIPWYFLHEPIYIIDNVPWYCKLKEMRYSSPIWAGFHWVDRILTPCLPFLLVLFLNALTVRHILAASRARKRLRAQSNGEKHHDPEMESRKKSIVLLFAISCSFILLWLAYVAYFVHERIHVNYNIKGFNDPVFILLESANMLQLLSCCTNTFIYAVTQRKFREQLKMAALSPLTLISKLVTR